MNQIKILIIEDEFIIAVNLKQLLTKHGYEVCGIANNYEEAFQKCTELNPDLVLTDIFLKNSKTGIEAILDLNKSTDKQTPVIVISAYSHEDALDKAMQVNPLYFITKPFTETQILTAVKLALKTVESVTKEELPSKRETDILELLAKGFSSKQIAERLFISVNTVESHRKNLMNKYNTSSSAELIFLAATKKWLS
jgi:DNA-binding NarL/FixJ family response regulator